MANLGLLCTIDYILFAATAKFKGIFLLSNHLQLGFVSFFSPLDDKLQSVACVIQQKYFQSSISPRFIHFYTYFSALYKVTEIIPKLVCKIQTEPPDHFMCCRRCLTFLSLCCSWCLL